MYLSGKNSIKQISKFHVMVIVFSSGRIIHSSKQQNLAFTKPQIIIHWSLTCWQKASMLQDCTHSHPNCDSICCVGFCLPWACTTVLLLVNGWKMSVMCLFISSLAWRCHFYLSSIVAGTTICFHFNCCWAVNMCASESLATDFWCFGWYFSLPRFQGKILCIISFMYYIYIYI